METHHDFGCATLEAGSHGSYFTVSGNKTAASPSSANRT